LIDTYNIVYISIYSSQNANPQKPQKGYRRKRLTKAIEPKESFCHSKSNAKVLIEKCAKGCWS